MHRHPRQSLPGHLVARDSGGETQSLVNNGVDSEDLDSDETEADFPPGSSRFKLEDTK